MTKKASLAQSLAEIKVANWIITGDQPSSNYNKNVNNMFKNHMQFLTISMMKSQIANITIQ